MASLGEVGDALQRVLDKIDQSIAAHHDAADLAEQARDLLTVAGSGTRQADVEEVCALFTRVVEGINEPEGQVSGLATAADLIRSYLRSHEMGHETGGTAPNTASPHATAPATPPPAHGSAQVDRLRAQLPTCGAAGQRHKDARLLVRKWTRGR